MRKKIFFTLFFALGLLALALVPFRGQPLGLLVEKAGGPYWVTDVPRDSVVRGDVLALLRGGREIARARVVQVQGTRAMVRVMNQSAPVVKGDQVTWLEHGIAPPDSGPPFPALATRPGSKPTPQALVEKYGDKAKRPGTLQEFQADRFTRPTVQVPQFVPPTPPSVTFQRPTVQAPTFVNPPFKNPTVTVTPFKLPPTQTVRPASFGVPALKPRAATRPSVLPQDAGLRDATGTRVVFQHQAKGDAVVLGTGRTLLPASQVKVLLGAVRSARAGQSLNTRVGEMQIQAAAGRLTLRLEGSSATFEGATLERLERLLVAWSEK